MKEKKLSKDELMDEVVLAMNSAVATAHQQYPFRKKRIEQAREQIKSFIEIFYAEKISTGKIKKNIPSPDLINWLKGISQAATCREDDYVMKATSQLITLIESSAQEPSEAEVKEFIEKWTSMMSVAFYESNIMHSIKLMLKEYEQLKRGTQNG